MHILIFLAILVGGIALFQYGFQIVKAFGTMPWAERAFGAGGSYTAWKIIGVVVIVGSIVFLRYGSLWGY
jgi:hypothetical protein